jgi:hypothetical protein
VLLPAAAAAAAAAVAVAAYRSICRSTLVMPHSSSVTAVFSFSLCAQGKKMRPLFGKCNCFCEVHIIVCT